MQTSNVGSARRSRRSRKAPEHFASQQAGLKEPDIESIERMFKMQEDARKNGKEANICICGIKLPRSARICKFCGWELYSKSDGDHEMSLTPGPKKKKRQLPIGKVPSLKRLKQLPLAKGGSTVTFASAGYRSSVGQGQKTSKEWTQGLGNLPLMSNIIMSLPLPLNRRVQAIKASQCRIRWHRKDLEPGKKVSATIIEPTIPCEASWCKRWFFRDADMLIHKFVKHIRPPYGFADQNSRHLEISDNEDSPDAPLNLVCSWSGCGRKFQTIAACGKHFAFMHKSTAKRGRKSKQCVSGKRVNTKRKHIPTKTLCSICSKPGGYTQGLRLQICCLCEKPCHMNCAITETSSVKPARKIYTCRVCHDKESRKSMKEIKAKIPIWNIYSTEEKINPQNAEIDYIDGFIVKSYCTSKS